MNHRCFQLKLVSWENYYNTKYNIEENYFNTKFSTSDKSLNITSGNAYVFNCLFLFMHESSGGAILFSQAESNILVEKSSFINCTASADTGSIRVISGNSIIAFTCCQNGYAKNNDGFCSIAAGNSNREIDSLFDSSISRCTAENSYIASHQYGFIHIKSINLSNNQARIVSSLNCCPNQIDSKTDFSTIISYCSFSNNTATASRCIRISCSYKPECKHSMADSNIIENNANETIYISGEISIYHCSFLGKADHFFQFETANSKIYLIFCYTENFNDKVSSLVSTIGDQISNEFTHLLPFYVTGKCINSFHYCSENSILLNHYFQKTIIPFAYILLLFPK